MPAKPENGDRRLDHGAQSVLQSTVYSQPWWHGVGNNASSGVGATKSSSMERINGSVGNGAIQSQVNGGLDNDANLNKEIQISVVSQSDGNDGQEHQTKHLQSSAPLTMVGQTEPNSQMELVGHSIVLTSYPYTDPQYGGILASYGSQTMVHPQLYAMHQTRMPLPLEMEEEPVYVNAKQYYGILRRRQSRAKAELEKKAIKARKPYLHESRHLHAMRRARGCGGRFLNTKKLDNNDANPLSKEAMNSGVKFSTQFASSTNATNGTGNDQHEGQGPFLHDMQPHSSSNGNSSGHRMGGGSLGQQREIMQGIGAPNGALSTR